MFVYHKNKDTFLHRVLIIMILIIIIIIIIIIIDPQGGFSLLSLHKNQMLH